MDIYDEQSTPKVFYLGINFKKAVGIFEMQFSMMDNPFPEPLGTFGKHKSLHFDFQKAVKGLSFFC